MADTVAAPPRRSALAGFPISGEHGNIGFAGPGVRIAERPPLSMVQFECRGEVMPGLIEAFPSIMGMALPTAPNTAVSKDGVRVIWVGPYRWMVVEQHSRDLVAHLQGALAAFPIAIVDQSNGRAAIRLSGRDARQVLAKGCSIDTHPSVFPLNACAQSTLFHISALIDCVDDAPVFDLYMARSYAVTFLETLVDAAAEYGCTIA
jgi:heterotetrameric sarcosine oxidase gamma subunit